MYIKRYTIASLMFFLLVGSYVYGYITKESMSIELFGIPLPSLSIAIWTLVPLVILYIASVAHMVFYSLVSTLKLRKYDKDYAKIIDSIVDAYLEKDDRSNNYKTSRYKLIGSFIDSTKFYVNKELMTDNKKINDVIDLIERVKRGEVVDLKPYKLSHDNELVLQNSKNRYKTGEINAEDVLSHSANYAVSFAKEVYVDFVKTSPMYAIEQYKEFLTKEALYNVLSRVNAEEHTLEISNDSLTLLFKNLELDKKEYIKISIALSAMIPEQRMKLFEILSDENDDATDAYLFTLFDLEMLIPAAEILEISQPDEYMNFKAYYALKDCNKHFNINLFI